MGPHISLDGDTLMVSHALHCGIHTAGGDSHGDTNGGSDLNLCEAYYIWCAGSSHYWYFLQFSQLLEMLTWTEFLLWVALKFVLGQRVDLSKMMSFPQTNRVGYGLMFGHEIFRWLVLMKGLHKNAQVYFGEFLQ